MPIRLLGACGTAMLVLLAATSPAHALAETSVYTWYDSVFTQASDSQGASSASAIPDARAEADLLAGTLKSYAETTTTEGHGASAHAYARIADTYTVAGLIGPDSVTVSLRVVGRLFSEQGNSTYSSFVVQFGGPYGTTLAFPGGDMAVDETFTLVFPVAPDTPSFDLSVELSSDAVGLGGVDALSDFGATATLGFVLPSGTSISSLQGFFQSSTPAVAEPTTVLLLSAALAAMAGLAGSRRRS